MIHNCDRCGKPSAPCTHRRYWIVWGHGPAIDPGLREASSTDCWPSEAEALLADRDDVWCVEVICTEERIDAITRHDPAVRGWQPAPAGCEECEVRS